MRHTARGVAGLPQTRHTRSIEGREATVRDQHSMNHGSSSTFASLASRSYLKSSAVMAMFGYKNRAAFWDFVRRDGVPHIRFNPRRIMFEEQALSDWLSRRSSYRR